MVPRTALLSLVFCAATFVAANHYEKPLLLLREVSAHSPSTTPFYVTPYGGGSIFVPDGEGYRELRVGGQVWLARPVSDGFVGVHWQRTGDPTTQTIYHVDMEGRHLLDGQQYRANVSAYFESIIGREFAGPHHDVVTTDTGYLFIARDRTPADEGSVSHDWLIEADRHGSVLWSWNIAEHLLGGDPVGLGERGENWIHVNSIDVTQTGDIVLSARNLNQVVVVSRPEGEVLSRFGDDVLSEQHHATVQSDGGFLVFDNGYVHRRSRVVKFSPSGDVEWILPLVDADGDPVFGPAYGSASVTTAGTLLICAGPSGQVLEVTRTGALIAEWDLLPVHDVPWAWNWGGRQSACYRVYEAPSVRRGSSTPGEPWQTSSADLWRAPRA